MAKSPTTITPETKKKKAPPVRAKSAKDPNIRMKMGDPFNQDAFKNVVVAPVELPPAPASSPAPARLVSSEYSEAWPHPPSERSALNVALWLEDLTCGWLDM
ncbi:hypothetical protein FQN55_005984 [Onygenales sp. PD_40]|nr:hypothetical protein FQN55_005984 [Onygenales sp. PD_40]KAK2772050.1 hypothetical protein FQN53_004790 [Emmonsiellopsis sp. PD_33]KAK2799658.1 hypothetical protein FQN51_006790 [Onygenales sp. PD_10]